MHGIAVERPCSGRVQPEPDASGGDLGRELEPDVLHEKNEQPNTKNVNRHF